MNASTTLIVVCAYSGERLPGAAAPSLRTAVGTDCAGVALAVLCGGAWIASDDVDARHVQLRAVRS